MPTVDVRIEPHDPILFGDNRSARAGEDHDLGDQEPSPATFYGAVGGRIATHHGALGRGGRWSAVEDHLGFLARSLEETAEGRARLLGYTLCDAAGEPRFPRPLNLRVRRLAEALDPWDLLVPCTDSEPGVPTSLPPGLARLVPAAHPPREDDAAPTGPVDEAEEPLWIDAELLAAALTAGDPREAALGAPLPSAAFHRPERRLGLTLSNRTNAAVAGRLFGRPYRRFLGTLSTGGWSAAGYRAWMEVLSLPASGASAWSGDGFLGGDRGRARFTFDLATEPPLGDLLGRVLAAAEAADGWLAYLLTPAVASVPVPVLGAHEPLAAALGRPTRISGWNAVGRPSGPRPVRTLIPAGSVLFFGWPAGCEAVEERRRLVAGHWLAALDEDLGAAGFGRVLTGVWRRP